MTHKLWLLTLFVVGFLILSGAFRLTQHLSEGELPPGSRLPDQTLSERQRVYLDRHTELNKWLIALSYAILGGLVTAKLSGNDRGRFDSFGAQMAAVLLVLSLFAGFLGHESVLIVMSSKPLDYLGSALTAFPIAAQMIFLAIGTAILTWSLLRSAAVVSAPAVPEDRDPSISVG